MASNSGVNMDEELEVAVRVDPLTVEPGALPSLTTDAPPAISEIVWLVVVPPALAAPVATPEIRDAVSETVATVKEVTGKAKEREKV